MEVLKKYLPDDVEEKRPEESVEQNAQEEVQNTPEEQHEYFDMKPLSPIYETCVGEQFRSHYHSGLLCQYKSVPLQEQIKNQGKGKDTGVLPDIPDE